MPYSSMSAVNPAIRGIDPPVTLAQANLIARMADGMEDDLDVENAWAAAIGQFKRMHKVMEGRWVKKEMSKSFEKAMDFLIEAWLEKDDGEDDFYHYILPDETDGMGEETLSKVFDGEPLLKFTGSPRNKFGTHSSHGFKGNYAQAWRIHFSKVGGGGLTGGAGGPLRGTVRRTEMIAAAMKPPCNLPSTESIGARSGGKSPLDGSFPEKPSDYGLSSWTKPESDEDREGMKLSCKDLAVIKRAALAEIKWRAAQREEAEKAYSLDEKSRQIRDAFNSQYKHSMMISDKQDMWVKEVFDDKVIVECSEGLMAYTYKLASDGKVTFGEPKKVEMTYVEKSDFELTVPILKANEERRLVYGVVLVPGRLDLQNDEIDELEIEKAAHGWMRKGMVLKTDMIDDQHGETLSLEQAYPVESYLAPCDFEVGRRLVKKGSWLLVTHVPDNAEWELVKSGKRKAYSIRGVGKRTPI